MIHFAVATDTDLLVAPVGQLLHLSMNTGMISSFTFRMHELITAECCNIRVDSTQNRKQ